MEDCKLIVRLKGKDIFSAGWQDISIPQNKKELQIAYTIINEYKNYLSGLIDGVIYSEKIKKNIK